MYDLYNVIICINYNNTVINNNYKILQNLIFFFKKPVGMLKNFFKIYRHFGTHPQKSLASPAWPKMNRTGKYKAATFYHVA
jgi:hypothetical protein